MPVQGINVNCSLLLLGAIAVVLPSLLSATALEEEKDQAFKNELSLSRFEAVFLLLLYGCYLLFQLYTHR